MIQADLAAQYIKSAVKNTPTVFLMTDSQVAEEQFLVLINDLLASGEIPGLFQDDEVENIISSMRPQVKSMGLQDTRENCWKFFIDKVRKQLKVRSWKRSNPIQLQIVLANRLQVQHTCLHNHMVCWFVQSIMK